MILTRIFLISLGFALACSACKRANDSPKPSGSTQPQAPATAAVTFSDFPVPPKPASGRQLGEHGKAVYEQNCVACHGIKGDGNGPAAAFLAPKPRSFVEAKFRLRSTLIGQLPTDVDLFRSVSLGMPGTPMPPWRHILNDEDRWAVVEYIKSFSPRFADINEQRTVINTGTPTLRNEASIAEGKTLFAKMGCIACHGESGHGDGPSAATLVDDSQNRIKPRDFSRPGAFKSGYSTKEIARTILTGFNGTPMPGFHGTITEGDAWKIANYVETFVKPTPTGPLVRVSQNFLVREDLGEPDVKIKLKERAWKYDPDVIRVKKGQIVEITFEPTDNGLGVGHGLAISSYDEAVFLNGAMVGAPKTVKFRADRAGKFTYYCSTQCSTEKLHPTMNGTLIVEEATQKETASLK
jgi:mono/diheme cytochrome c family protein